ncbi:MAG: hypothetical protein GY810_15475 [Aureispira sp.]|nr:hypothetical protein [Aureispira sp.]
MFKNLKSLFVVDDGNDKQSQNDDSPKDKVDNSNIPPQNSNQGGNSIIKVDQPPLKDKVVSNLDKTPKNTDVPASIEMYNGQVNDKFLKVLFDAMENANLDGFDYLEFRQSLQSLKNIPMDDATRYQSALAMAQTMKATPDQLILSAKHYINKLSDEEKKFGNAMKGQIDQKVGNRQNEVKTLEEQIKQKTEEIKKLTTEITQHQQKISETQAYISEATLQIEMRRKDFLVSYQKVVGQIQQDIGNMETYLQGKTKPKPPTTDPNKGNK